MLSYFELLYYVYILLSLYFQTCLCRYFYDSCIFTQLRFNCAAAPVLDDDGYDFSVKNAAIDRESWREIRSNCKLMKFVNLQLSSPGNLFKAGAFRKDEFGGCTQNLQGTHVSLQLYFYTLKEMIFCCWGLWKYRSTCCVCFGWMGETEHPGYCCCLKPDGTRLLSLTRRQW